MNTSYYCDHLYHCTDTDDDDPSVSELPSLMAMHGLLFSGFYMWLSFCASIYIKFGGGWGLPPRIETKTCRSSQVVF